MVFYCGSDLHFRAALKISTTEAEPYFITSFRTDFLHGADVIRRHDLVMKMVIG